MENSLPANKNKIKLHSGDLFFTQDTAVVLLLNTLICSVVGILVWVGFPPAAKSGLLSSWVYAQCIGQLICIGILAHTHIQKKKSQQPGIGYYLIFPVIVFLGFFVGKTLAAFLMGTPIEPYFNTPVFWTTLLITCCVSTFAIWFFSSRDRVMNLKMIAAEESAQASRAKLSMLQAQLEPHMLFNTLSNLRMLIEDDPEQARLMLDTLVDYLRATLASSMHDKTSLKEEFALLENYLSLMQMRMGDRLTFDLHLPKELEDIPVPILILQPLVENAIKHGLEPSIDGGTISVRARSEQDRIAVEVQDTGIGYNLNSITLTEGFGLRSVRERLNTNLTHYEALSIVSPLKNNSSGTSITVQIPCA